MFLRSFHYAFAIVMIAVPSLVTDATAMVSADGLSQGQNIAQVDQDDVKVPNLPLPRNDTSAPVLKVKPLFGFDPWRFAFRPLDRAALTLSKTEHLTFAGRYTFVDQYSSELIAKVPGTINLVDAAT